MDKITFTNLTKIGLVTSWTQQAEMTMLLDHASRSWDRVVRAGYEAAVTWSHQYKVTVTICMQLLKGDRSVVAAVRSAEKARETLGQLTENFNQTSQLAIEEGVDVTQKESLQNPKLWEGVSQVAIAVGPVFKAGG